MAEEARHLETRAMKAALDRSDRDVQRSRGLGVVQILEVVQNENGAMFLAHVL
jgi:hypothetical protein